MSKRSANMRRNGEYFHVVSPGRATVWRGFDAVNVRTSNGSTVIPARSQQEAESIAASIVGDGLAAWAAVMGRDQAPVSVARRDDGVVLLHTATQYGVAAGQVYTLLNDRGRLTPKLERYRHLIATERYTPEEELMYTSALADAVEKACSLPKTDRHPKRVLGIGEELAMGFIGRTYRYHETPSGYVRYGEVNYGPVEVIFNVWSEPALSLDWNERAHRGYVLDPMTKAAFSKIWEIALAIT